MKKKMEETNSKKRGLSSREKSKELSEKTNPRTQQTEASKSKKTSKPKKKKIKYLPDDGHTIYSMDGVKGSAMKSDGKGEKLPKEDRRVMIKSAFAVYGPVFLTIVICFTLVMVLIYFWLK